MFRKLTIVVLGILMYSLAIGQSLDMDKMKGLKPRNIGPSGTSGRVTAIDVVASNPDIIYVGSASGGLWKSIGGGISWKPIFDKEKAASIGAISIFQKNPNIIYVGTGEGNPRNSQNMGNGVYKTLDGGETWQYLGLENTRAIHRIFVHPDDPNTVLVGVQGNAWADSEDRGVFKTTDGGKTWRKVLYVNKKTGIADMKIDPTNPNKIVAGMWEFRREPWFFKSGGAGSGLYISSDGGETWKQKTKDDGLPEGEIGKIGVAIAPSEPNIIYALIESKKSALYKSIDGGVKWNKVQDKEVGDRPFYYFDIQVDPQNENRVYNIFSNVKVSIDGGKNYETLLGWDKIHGDHHYWYIHPTDGSFIIDGNDGGVAISRDKGKSWKFVENLPLEQFYHINVDMGVPYNVMGGLQDNGSWRGPSQSLRFQGGIRNAYWEEVAFGDGFDVVPVPNDPDHGYGMWQGGNLLYINFKNGYTQYIKPTHPDNIFLRFNWNSGIAQDPFDQNTIYYGSQFVHKSTDRGQNWSLISNDLTSNDLNKQKQLETGGLSYDATGAENHCTIITIAPSSKQKNVIWAGTDDGNIQVTQDGINWTEVSKNIPNYPKGAWVPQIQASTYNVAEAFVVVNDYRRGNWSPMLFYTKDFGKTWTNLVDDKKVSGYVLCSVQDPVQPNLLFVGTEFGMYISLDFGKTFTKWTNEYPTVSTYDMVIHPREYDLVIGTFGRSAWILDDIRPLRELASKGTNILSDMIYVYPTPDAYQFTYRAAAGTHFHGDAMFQGTDRPFGAMITFSIKNISKKDTTIKSDTVRVKIFDTQGNNIRTFTKVVTETGMNRIFWGLDKKGVRSPDSPKQKPEDDEPSGVPVAPGEYTVSLTFNKKEVSTKVKVLPDPRHNFNEEHFKIIIQKSERLMKIMDEATAAIDKLNDAKDIIGKVNNALAENQSKELNTDTVKNRGGKLEKRIQELKETIKTKEDIFGIYDNPRLPSERIYRAFNHLGYYDTPNKNQDIAIEQAEKATKDALEKVNLFFENEWKNYKAEAQKVNFSPIK